MTDALRLHATPLVPTDEVEPQRPVQALALAALGVVYGDIGTSPLYALKQCFVGANAIAPDPNNVLGVLSLIVWSLVVVVSIKYLLVILNADNKGEGGIIALVALLNPWHASSRSRRHVLMLMGLFGAALLYGDGTITPAISVLSAIEGLGIATPAFDPYVVPMAVVVLLLLFLAQKHGTTKIGALFGPIMLAWFAVLGLLGINGILREPGVLIAVRPDYALRFLFGNGLIGFVILGTVFLAVTGAETLYADMGHFGRRPIRLAWFVVALPALLLNYFGQGALILGNSQAAAHPFYGLSPSWMIYPLVALATLATVIASQAVISGTFSLTRQAVQLGQLPRMRIVQTDPDHVGQIYVPAVNWALMIATIWLVLGFRTSTNLGSAYGLAVSLDMVITTILAFFVALRWKWHPLLAGVPAIMFLVVDLAFFGSNLFKIASGGWYPLAVALVIFTIMTVWRLGLRDLGALTRSSREPLEDFLDRLAKTQTKRVPGTAVFMTGSKTDVPSLLSYLLEHNHVLHERIVLVTVVIDDVPRVPTADRFNFEEFRFGFGRAIVHYGFVQSPNIPVALKLGKRLGFDLDPETVTYYLGHEEVIPARSHAGLAQLRTQLFAFLWRNAVRATAFYNIPVERAVVVGLQVAM